MPRGAKLSGGIVEEDASGVDEEIIDELNGGFIGLAIYGTEVERKKPASIPPAPMLGVASVGLAGREKVIESGVLMPVMTKSSMVSAWAARGRDNATAKRVMRVLGIEDVSFAKLVRVDGWLGEGVRVNLPS